jgi:BirA family biotin operon repressor/biotin-[acetyl-CoA-carboxylase] ligase
MFKSDALDSDKIKTNLKTEHIGKKIIVYDSTSSTNDVAAKYAKNKKNNGLAIFTEEQTAGRGRAANKWLTGRADSILCSILLTESKLNGELLSLACAVATAEAIGRIGPSRANIKWPNDIILNGKKLAGILLESKVDNGRKSYIIGIGINCHQRKDSFPYQLQQTATSIDIESGSFTDRVSLAKRLLTSIDHWLETTGKSSRKVINRWRKLSIQLGHRVTLVFNDKKFTGNCIGIDPEKGLIVQLDTGGTRFFDAAHTTIGR